MTPVFLRSQGSGLSLKNAVPSYFAMSFLNIEILHSITPCFNLRSPSSQASRTFAEVENAEDETRIRHGPSVLL